MAINPMVTDKDGIKAALTTSTSTSIRGNMTEQASTIARAKGKNW